MLREAHLVAFFVALLVGYASSHCLVVDNKMLIDEAGGRSVNDEVWD